MVSAKIHITATTNLPTRFGNFKLESFRFAESEPAHLALSMGMEDGDRSCSNEVTLVRLHSECLTGDAFGSIKCDCGDQLHDAMGRIASAGRGIVIYLRQEGRGIGIENKIQAYALQEGGLDTVDANLALGLPVDARCYDPATAYLDSVRVRQCVLLTNNPEKVTALEAVGIAATRAPLLSSQYAACAPYLATKRERLNHDC